MSGSSNPRAVAVIMSVYAGDAPDHLSQALSSVLAQDISEKRRVHVYLGVDGPIGAELRAVLELWEDRIHSYQPFERNRGLAHVLNDLIRSLQSEEYVFRMDADDVSLPGRFSAQVQFMEQKPEIGICGTAINEMGEGGQRRLVTYPATHEEAMDALKWRSPFAHPTVCFRRSALDRLGSYPTAAANEDIAMWFRAAASGIRFGNLKAAHLDFRIADGFWKRRGLAKAAGEFRCYWQGLKSLGAPPFHFMYPPLRFVFRLTPATLRKYLYASKIRS
ncbi:glycosyltransferase [Erythrobacter sp. GH1-10]|uniref:glycosyltransferase n=1 Tax=Erythrobacter sp. GH1-10 TaxID=3349334 RepID=UPI003877D378